MADVQETISVQSEVQAICAPLVQEAKDIKAKAPAATYASDGMPLVLALLGGFGSLAADIKTAECQAYLALTIGRIVAVFDGAA